MNIQSVDVTDSIHRLAGAHRRTAELTAVRRESAGRATERVARSATIDPPTEAEAPTERQAGEQEGEKARGVIRHLEAGHFKGVADVRLRINFFEELSQRAAESAGPVIDERSQNLVDTVGAKVDELTAGLAVDEATRTAVGDLVSQFEAQVGAALDSGGTATTLAGDVQAAFDVLVTQLRELLTTPATQEPADDEALGDATAAPRGDALEPTLAEGAAGTVSEADTTTTAVRSTDAIRTTGDTLIDAPVAVATEPVTTAVSDDGPVAEEPAQEAQTSLDEALASLQLAFQDAFASLITAIDSGTLLADPAPSSGNGSAYDKFLGIYNDLRGLPTTVDESA